MSVLRESEIQSAKDDTASSVDSSERFEKEVSDEQHRRGEITKGVAEYTAKRDAVKDLDESRDLREELERRFRGRRASEVLRDFAKLDAEMRRDPKGAAYALAERYARSGRFGDGPEKPKQRESLRQAGSIGRELEDAMRQHRQDKGETEAILEALKALPGMTPREALKRILDFDGDAVKDPLGAAGRLALQYGMPLTEEQAQQQPSEADRQWATATFAEIQRHPALKDRGADVAELVRNGAIQWTGDTAQDVAVVVHTLQWRDGLTAAIKRATGADFESVRPKAVQILRSGKVHVTGDASKDAAAVLAALNVKPAKSADGKGSAKARNKDAPIAGLRDELRRNLSEARAR